MAMLTVYSNQGSGNCYKVRLLLTQAGEPFRTVDVDVVAGEQRTPDFLARNPIGKVPILEFPDGTTLPESGAILYHFSQDTPLWPAERLQQSQVLQWMFFEQYSHEPNIAVARYWCHYLKAEDDYKEQLVGKRQNGDRALGVMDHHLSAHRFFVAENYSIADIALYAYTHVAHEGGFDLSRFPHIQAWLGRVKEQPGHITMDHRC
jgi:glutathione S-transferase